MCPPMRWLLSPPTVANLMTGMQTALHEVVGVADGLLWSNAASALVPTAAAMAADQLDEHLNTVVQAMLSRPPLPGRIVTTPDK